MAKKRQADGLLVYCAISSDPLFFSEEKKHKEAATSLSNKKKEKEVTMKTACPCSWLALFFLHKEKETFCALLCAALARALWTLLKCRRRV